MKSKLKLKSILNRLKSVDFIVKYLVYLCTDQNDKHHKFNVVTERHKYKTSACNPIQKKRRTTFAEKCKKIFKKAWLWIFFQHLIFVSFILFYFNPFWLENVYLVSYKSLRRKESVPVVVHVHIIILRCIFAKVWFNYFFASVVQKKCSTL